MRIGKTFSEILKFNHNHDRLGRFCSAGSAVSPGSGKKTTPAAGTSKKPVTTTSTGSTESGTKSTSGKKQKQLTPKQERQRLFDKWYDEKTLHGSKQDFKEYEKEHATYMKGNKSKSAGSGSTKNSSNNSKKADASMFSGKSNKKKNVYIDSSKTTAGKKWKEWNKPKPKVVNTAAKPKLYRWYEHTGIRPGLYRIDGSSLPQCG